jgi:hypothetical protein
MVAFALFVNIFGGYRKFNERITRLFSKRLMDDVRTKFTTETLFRATTGRVWLESQNQAPSEYLQIPIR